MAASYRIFRRWDVALLRRVRPYFRYKGIPQQWIFDALARFRSALAEPFRQEWGDKAALDPVLDPAGCPGGLRA
jgi:hypothetical protein